MNEPMILLHTTPTGGTPNGITTAEEYAYGCARRVWLKRFQPETAVPSFPSKPSGADIGTYGHIFLEHHYRSQMEKTSTNVAALVSQYAGDPASPSGYREAYAAYQRYLLKYARNDLGTVIDVEQFIATNELLLKPYTCKIDLIVRVTPKSAKQIYQLRGLIVEPGVYLVDHKFLNRLSMLNIIRYGEGLQAPAYLQAYNSVVAKKRNRAKGVLINMVCTASNDFETIMANTNGNTITPRFETLAKRCQSLGWPISEDKKPPVNEKRCFDFNDICPFYKTSCFRV